MLRGRVEILSSTILVQHQPILVVTENSCVSLKFEFSM